MEINSFNQQARGIRSFKNWSRFFALGLLLGAGIITIIASSGGSGPDFYNEAVWTFDLGGIAGKASPAIGVDGTIYAGSRDDHLYAINPVGSEQWRFLTGSDISTTPAIGSDGTIYIGSDKFYAINPDGSEQWNYITGSGLPTSAAVGGDGTVYVGAGDVLHAINPDGSEKWRYSEGASGSSPAIACDGTIYVGLYDSSLHAINADGTQKWRFAAGDAVTSSPAIGGDGTLYVGSLDGNLYAINPDGSEKWRFATGDQVISSPAIGIDGTIYVGSRFNRLYAINPDGSEKWNYLAGGPVSSSPSIGSDGTIYVGSENFYLNLINPDGTLKRRYETRFSSNHSVAIAGNDMIYLVSADLMAIPVAGSRLADTPWPMFLHDLKRTGKQSDTAVPGITEVTAADSQLTILWDPVPGISSYNLYWSTSPGVTLLDNKISGVNNPYVHGSLVNGITYYYALTTQNPCGESALSSEASATPVSGGPYTVAISPGDNTTLALCPELTLFSANVTGGTTPYSYSWLVTSTAGPGLNTIGSTDQQMIEICAWDSMSAGTVEVIVIDSNSRVINNEIRVDGL